MTPDLHVDSFTGEFTTMQVPHATSVKRPSWSVPLDGAYYTVPLDGAYYTTSNTSRFAVSGIVASIDPYCELYLLYI
jgi:hypothetical protein